MKSGGVENGAADDISNRFTAAFRKGGSAISGKRSDRTSQFSLLRVRFALIEWVQKRRATRHKGGQTRGRLHRVKEQVTNR